MEIVDAARALGDGGAPLVFAGNDGEPLDERVLRLLEQLRVPAVPHGFRSSFRDWAAEETDHRREVIEAALAHVVGNKVETAYARSNLFERRRLNGRLGLVPVRPEPFACSHHGIRGRGTRHRIQRRDYTRTQPG